MLTKDWQSVQVNLPHVGVVPLPRLYGSGFFVSEIFGSELWVINKRTFESKCVRAATPVPTSMCAWMEFYNKQQYKRFAAKTERLRRKLRLSKTRQ